uniref:F-box domain-containing protein n=1 Tax=Glossina brevipalpis TaxID=37001 RepID=A0A1A9WWR0_9MUSC
MHIKSLVRLGRVSEMSIKAVVTVYFLHIAIGKMQDKNLENFSVYWRAYNPPINLIINTGPVLENQKVTIQSVVVESEINLFYNSSTGPVLENQKKVMYAVSSVRDHEYSTISELCDELLIKIFGYLKCKDLRQISLVNRKWHQLAYAAGLNKKLMWRIGRRNLTHILYLIEHQGLKLENVLIGNDLHDRSKVNKMFFKDIFKHYLSCNIVSLHLLNLKSISLLNNHMPQIQELTLDWPCRDWPEIDFKKFPNLKILNLPLIEDNITNWVKYKKFLSNLADTSGIEKLMINIGECNEEGLKVLEAHASSLRTLWFFGFDDIDLTSEHRYAEVFKKLTQIEVLKILGMEEPNAKKILILNIEKITKL